MNTTSASDPPAKPNKMHLPVSGEVAETPVRYENDDPLTIDTSEV